MTNAVKISVLLEPSESERFGAYCHEKGYKKSSLIARLIREHLEREGYHHQPNLFGAGGAKNGKTNKGEKG